MNRLTIKSLSSLVFFLLFYSFAFSWCIAGRGTTCKKKKEESANSTKTVTVGEDGSVEREDGGAKNKREKGDKGEYQGYAEFRRHFAYYSYAFLAVAHQQANRSSDSNNRAIGYEYAFNPFVSGKVERAELFYDSFVAKSNYTNIYNYALLNVRIYLFNTLVLRSGVGYGIGSVERKNKDGLETSETFSGNVNVLQTSLMYIFGDENTMMGVTSTTVEGRDGEKENLGSTFYAFALSLGF